MDVRTMSIKERKQSETTAKPYSQKYVLQGKNAKGHWMKLETFTQPISQEETLARFGPGTYALKSMKPRIRVVWKAQLGVEQAADESQKKEISRLNRHDKYLAVGEVALAAGEVTGFTLTHLRLKDVEEDVRSIRRLLPKPGDVKCQACGAQVDYYIQKNCGLCGSPLQWSQKIVRNNLNPSLECSRCGEPLLAHHNFCVNCGQRIRGRPIEMSTQTARSESGHLSGATPVY